MNTYINETAIERWKKVIKESFDANTHDLDSRLDWMATMAQHQTMNESKHSMMYDRVPLREHMQSLNEEAVGGVSYPYATLNNTNGIGNAVPPQMAGQSAASQTSPKTIGSGDKWNTTLPISLQVAGRTIGFDLLNVIPQAMPTGVIPYMDYIYGTGKDIYGATPGYDNGSINPSAEIHKKADTVLAFKVPMGSTDIAKLTKGAKGKFTQDAKQVEVIFVERARLDGYPIFRVLGFNPTNANLADVFTADTVAGAFGTKGDDGNYTGVTVDCSGRPMAVSALEDHIQGYTGAGEKDEAAWTGSWVDGTEIYDPMDRGTGENAYARTMSLKLFTKSFQVGTQQISVSATQEQIQDLQKQWGIDVIKMLIEAGINEISQSINKQITSQLFALGWLNHLRAEIAEGINVNLNLTQSSGTLVDTPAYVYVDNGRKYNESMKVENLSFGPTDAAPLSNIDVMSKYLYAQILLANNVINQRGRRGAANFVVLGLKLATLLQQGKNYSFAAFDNQIDTGSIYPLGKIGQMTIYVDPNMRMDDTRVLVGRKGSIKDPGLFFCPYLMAESVQIITEGTMAPKCLIKSRYQIITAGFHPETMYLTFYIKTGKGLI